MSSGDNTNVAFSFRWEGTLDGRVGWFPADFVGIVKIAADGGRKAVESPGRGATRNGPGTAMDVTKLEANRVAMRAQLVQDFLAKDKEHLEAIGRALDALIGLAKASTELWVDGQREMGIFLRFSVCKTSILGQPQPNLPILSTSNEFC